MEHQDSRRASNGGVKHGFFSDCIDCVKQFLNSESKDEIIACDKVDVLILVEDFFKSIFGLLHGECRKLYEELAAIELMHMIAMPTYSHMSIRTLRGTLVTLGSDTSGSSAGINWVEVDVIENICDVVVNSIGSYNSLANCKSGSERQLVLERIYKSCTDIEDELKDVDSRISLISVLNPLP
jgi:hypothetical protein